ncbi:ankyrin repeat domain-containing protein [Ruegeria sp. SCP11]|uniref:ankyrin repeat domain-containing protein n=1 Tax=Ruegeria sp. SCP11 TaxID=3141378 RepID=UPI00333C797D
MLRFSFANFFLFLVLAVVLSAQVAKADEILQAARKGDTEALETSLAAEGSVDPTSLERPLFFAAQSGHTDIVAILLEHGADANTMLDFGSPLQKAARGNHEKIVELLLKAGADPSAQAGDKDYTPLHDAAERGALDAAKILVAYGANVNAREFWGVPPIHLATIKEKAKMVSFLSESGARPIEPPPVSETELATADLELGRIAAISCTQCHIIEEGTAPSGAHNHGPSLIGVVGRAKAGVEGYNYSNAMASLSGVWSVSELNQFIADPAGRVPGTEMALMPDLSDAERVALIAYLGTLRVQ